MTPNEAEQALYNDLLSIYARAGAEVTYETDDGTVKAYWPKRFLQAVKRAAKKEELFEFVNRLLQSETPSRGFFILEKAGRLDLTVEALVIDDSKPYWSEMDFDLIAVARRRLADHGHPAAFEKKSKVEDPPSESGPTPSPAVRFPFAPGTTFHLRVTVADNGELSLSLV